MLLSKLLLLGKLSIVVSLGLWVHIDEYSVATGYENVLFENETVVDVGENVADRFFVEPVENCFKKLGFVDHL